METHSPESVGMSSSRLDRISAVMNEFVKDNQLPGILTLIQRKGKVIHYGEYGMMDIEAGRPIEEDALFRIFSMTKPITSVAMLMLYEEGKLSLKDPVSKFIPAFGKTKVYAGSTPLSHTLVDQDPPMNILHLLTHTSGLSYGWYLDTPVEEMYRQAVPNLFDQGKPLSEVVQGFAELPLVSQPGSAWRYSFSTDVLGHVVEVIADMPLGDFFKERIFNPLGMVDTDFYVPAEKIGRLAQIYASEKLYDPVIPEPSEIGMTGDLTKEPSIPSGGGGLISTLSDYLKFANCLLYNGRYDGGRLLGRKTIEWMRADHIPQSLKPIKMGPEVLDIGFGLGVGVVTGLGEAQSLASVGAHGWSGAARTDFWVDPAEELIGLFMTQHMPLEPYPVQERFRTLAYQAIDD